MVVIVVTACNIRNPRDAETELRVQFEEESLLNGERQWGIDMQKVSEVDGVSLK